MKFHLNKAFPLFTDWITNAKLSYPQLNYQISDATIFKNDLQNAMFKAVNGLNKAEKIECRKSIGYDYGFICGFIQGNLNAAWYSEYIYKQTNQYKLFTVINTIDSFFKFDDLLRIRLSNLYTEHYKTQLNLENIDAKIDIDLPKNLDFLDIENSGNPILVALENIKIEMIKKMFCDKTPDFLTTVSTYFTHEDIAAIIKQNE